jgi:hypothetical protein
VNPKDTTKNMSGCTTPSFSVRRSTAVASSI